MGVRHERVIVELDDRFTTPMARQAAATSVFRRNLDDSNKSVLVFDKTTKDTSANIDRFSGRLAILGRVAAALGPALAPISVAAIPAISGLTNQMAFAAAGAGSLLLAFNGVGDGLKALNEYQLEPTAENLAKMQEKMAGLGPEAREFVRYLDQAMPQLQSIREAAQAGALPGATRGMDALFERLPQIRDLMFTIADAAGDLMGATGEDLASDRWDDFFAFLQNEARPALETLGQTVGNLVSGLAEMWMAFDPVSDDFSVGFLRMSESFEQWAAGLSESEGFAEFVDYLRTAGPQVLDFLGSLTMMLVDIGKAAAPIGGPVLEILTAVADVIGTIADSLIGPVLIGAASAMSALSLASRGFQAAMGTSAVSSVRTMSADLRTMGQVGVVAWGRTADETKRFNDAAARTRTTLGGIGKQAALVGGLAVATSGLGDSFGYANTASLALMGTMAGPWGTALGGATGFVMDLAAANDGLEESFRGLDEALKADDLAAAEARLKSATAQVEKYQDRINYNWIPVAGPWITELTDDTDEWVKKQKDAEEAVGQLKREMNGLPSALGTSADAYREHTKALEANITAHRTLREERLRARNAELNYEASIDDATAAFEKNGRTLDKTTDKGRANWQALLALASGWNGLSDRMKNTDGAHRRAIDSFVEVAAKMGMEEDAARRLANRLMEIPPERKTKILVDAGQAYAVIDGVRVALRNLDGTVSTTYVRTVRQNVVTNRLGGEPGVADGGTILGQRHPYGDKVWAMLAPGEEVISNRYGQADKHRELLRAINANRYAGYANGGTVANQTRVSVTTPPVSLDGMSVRGTLDSPWGPVDALMTLVDDRIAANADHGGWRDHG